MELHSFYLNELILLAISQLKAYILKDDELNKSTVYDTERPDTKKIKMDVKVLQTNGAFSLLEIELITGRSHQLRAHLAHLGNPIAKPLVIDCSFIKISYLKN